MTRKLLIRGGTVLSMDGAIGDLPRADILIEDDTIAAVRPDISADADVIDAEGFIAIPGFVDTHRHTWEAAIRGCAPDATLDDYFVEILDTFAPHYRPEDVYAANLAGALECLNAGITTLVDWSHINNTPDHPDAAMSLNNLAEVLRGRGNLRRRVRSWNGRWPSMKRRLAPSTPIQPGASTISRKCCEVRGNLRRRPRSRNGRWPSVKRRLAPSTPTRP